MWRSVDTVKQLQQCGNEKAMRASWGVITWSLGSLGIFADGSRFLCISEVPIPPYMGFPHAQPPIVRKVRHLCRSKPCSTLSPL